MDARAPLFFTPRLPGLPRACGPRNDEINSLLFPEPTRAKAVRLEKCSFILNSSVDRAENNETIEKTMSG
jgi:hypothetical protein